MSQLTTTRYQPEVTCSCCGGKGHRRLPKKLAQTLKEAVELMKSVESFSVSQLAEPCQIDSTTAHHRITRLVELGVLKRWKKVTPARFVVV